MKNVDRWFILTGLLYASFGFAFGIWVGINERFDQAHLHAHINLVGWASMTLFGLIYRAYPALAESRLAAVHFILFNIGASCSSWASRWPSFTSRSRSRPAAR